MGSLLSTTCPGGQLRITKQSEAQLCCLCPKANFFSSSHAEELRESAEGMGYVMLAATAKEAAELAYNHHTAA